MQQTFEYYIVNPNTWKDDVRYRAITACSINRDGDTDTLGSATLDITEPINECYMRSYLVTNQNGVEEKHPLGTFLVQIPNVSFNGKRSSMTADGYTSLIELKEKQPPIGFFIQKYRDVVEAATSLADENARAPVVSSTLKTWYPDDAGTYQAHSNYLPAKEWAEKGTENQHLGDIFYDDSTYLNPVIHIWRGYVPEGETGIVYRWERISESDLRTNEIGKTRLGSDFVADPEDDWFKYLSEALSYVDKKFDLDELGRISIVTKKKLDSMQPVWTYTDDNSSILNPEVDVDCDIFGIPNVVEVIYTTTVYSVRCVVANEDPNSQLSIQSRGRRIVHRVTDPGFTGVLSKNDAIVQVENYAKQLLKELSTIERTLTYTHGYCPVRLDDCVRFDYTRADLKNIKAKVVSQSIKCIPGCPVTEKAVYTTKLINESHIVTEYITPKE